MDRTTAGIIDIPDSPALTGHEALRAHAVKATAAAPPARFGSTVAGTLQPAAKAQPRRAGTAGYGHCRLAVAYHHWGLRIRPDLA